MAQPDPITDADQITITNTRDQIERVERAILAAVERHGYSKASVFAIRLALEEAVVNAFKHGHKELPDHVPVHVVYAVGPDEVRISIEDQGPGFNPGDVPDPTLDENLQVPSGRGLMLIRAYMSEVSHDKDGNRLSMVYRRPTDEDGDD